MATFFKSRKRTRSKIRRLDAPVDEQYRQAAMRLWRVLRESVIPAVVFTSATPCEGTSTTVTEIARHMRDAFGLQPLLVRLGEPDPATRRLLMSEDEHSHEDLLALSNGQNLPNCVKPGPHALPTVSRLERKVAATGTSRLQTAIARILRERQPAYSCVLIDAPAIFESTDAIAICEVVPQVVLVVAAGYTRSEVVDRAITELEEHEVAIVGTILNKHKRVIPDWFYRSFVQ